MNEQIKSILDAGRKKIEEHRAVYEAACAEAVRRQQVEVDYLRRALLALVPAALHELCEIDAKRGEVAICLPGAAQVVSDRNALEYQYDEIDDGVRVVSKVALAYWKKTEPWKIMRWDADDEGELYLRIVDKTDDLDVALVRAVEMGDGHDEAEAKVSELKEMWKMQEQKPKPRLCPLKTASGENIGYVCDLEQCAWFVQYRGFDQCAIKVLAVTAIHHAPDLE